MNSGEADRKAKQAPAEPKRRRASGRKKPTLATVSRAAGVSTATVSRFLNSPDLVTEETRILIQREIERTGYLHGKSASILSRRSFTIGAIVPNINNLLSANVLNGFQGVLQREGYELLLASFENDPTTVARKVENFIRRKVDAVFIVSAQHDEELYARLAERKMPFVTSWPPEKSETIVPHVAYDHREAALKPVRYLLDLGHREFALITGALGGNRRLRERHDEVTRLLKERGAEIPQERIVDVGTYDLGSARRAFQHLASQGPLPTAIVASNDIIAGGVILECHARGIRVPTDISVTGFGDIELAAQFSPSITTVRTPRTDLGSLAAQYLIRRLRGEDAIDAVALEVELIVRESTASIS